MLIETKIKHQLKFIERNFDKIKSGSTEEEVIKDHLKDMRSILNDDFYSKQSLINFHQRVKFLASSFCKDNREAMNNLYLLASKGYY